jgi:hypothetical protein
MYLKYTSPFLQIRTCEANIQLRARIGSYFGRDPYFTNNIGKSRMNYAESVHLNHPIGSGVTEAACKTIVKQRLGQSGMQWKDKGAGVILSLRALVHSTGRWEQFGNKVNQFGLPMAV